MIDPILNHPFKAPVDQITIEEIAHSLSRQCRFMGYVDDFYSVAQHSVILFKWFRENNAPISIQQWALMHDACEAFIQDIPSGKGGYKQSLFIDYDGGINTMDDLERITQAKIGKRFNLSPKDYPPEEVMNGDKRIIADEFFYMRTLFPPTYELQIILKEIKPLEVGRIVSWKPNDAKEIFLAAARRLNIE